MIADRNTTESKRNKRDTFESTTMQAYKTYKVSNLTNFTSSLAIDIDNEENSIDRNNSEKEESPGNSRKNKLFPVFHVTYWMFYPYSQVI